MKPVTIISTFMGASMVMFGFLKLLYPVSVWFIRISIMISTSSLALHSSAMMALSGLNTTAGSEKYENWYAY